VYFNVNFNVILKLIKVHLLVSVLCIVPGNNLFYCILNIPCIIDNYIKTIN